MENTHNKIFLIDLDGVIADFSLGVVNEYNKRYTPELTLEQAENTYEISDKEPYKSIVEQPGFFANLPIHIKRAGISCKMQQGNIFLH